MLAPPGLPPRIRSDASNPFAQHTMAVRVPAILDTVLRQNPDLEARSVERITRLREALSLDRLLPELAAGAPHAAEWRATLPGRAAASWGACDWFFAENYAYRCLTDAVDFWQRGRDPFLPIKREEYASAGHAQALATAAAISGERGERLARLLLGSLFANRMDLS